MDSNPIRGKTLRFTFDDGPMAGKTFQHRFDAGGTVSFHAVGGNGGGAEVERTPGAKYECAMVRDGVWAVSYRSSAGYTLTTILDFATRKIIAFSSNEKMLALQHGSFEEEPAAMAEEAEAPRRDATRAHAARP